MANKEKLFDKEVYEGYDNAVKIVKKEIEPNGNFDVDKVLEIVAKCSVDSEYKDKYKMMTTHAEEKRHRFLIARKKEQYEMFEERFARCIPNKDALTVIKEFVGDQWMLEINMHRGLWTALLRGIKVPKIDILTLGKASEEDKSKWFIKPLEWIVDESNKDIPPPTPSQLYDMITEHYNTLLIVDPKAGDEANFVYECLGKFKGGKVVFIGTEDEESPIYKLLEAKFKLAKFALIANWFDNDDYVMCYDRIEL